MLSILARKCSGALPRCRLADGAARLADGAARSSSWCLDRLDLAQGFNH